MFFSKLSYSLSSNNSLNDLTTITWVLDALATATLIMFGQLCLNAIAVPAIKGYQMTMEFKQSFKEK